MRALAVGRKVVLGKGAAGRREGRQQPTRRAVARTDCRSRCGAAIDASRNALEIKATFCTPARSSSVASERYDRCQGHRARDRPTHPLMLLPRRNTEVICLPTVTRVAQAPLLPQRVTRYMRAIPLQITYQTCRGLPRRAGIGWQMAQILQRSIDTAQPEER